MNKSLAFIAGWCVFSLVYFIAAMATTEGNPTARAAMGGIGILCYFLVLHFVPIDHKRETTHQKIVFALQIILEILAFLILIMMIGMVQTSLVEAGYISGDVCIECGP